MNAIHSSLGKNNSRGVDVPLKSINNRAKNIKVKYRLSKRKIKKLNEKYDLVVGFDDIFKTDNCILSIESRTNRMIGRMIRNSI